MQDETVETIKTTTKTIVSSSDNPIESADKGADAQLQIKTPQTIIVGRHGKPELNRSVFLNAREYIDWWRQYDEGGLVKNQKVPRKLLNLVAKTNKIIASPLPRAYETAQAIVGERAIVTNEVFVEAPLPPPLLPNFFKLRPRLWGFVARCTWFIGFSGDGESHNEAKIRAKAAAAQLVNYAQSDGTVALFAHGWFNRMMRPHILAHGFKLIYDGGDTHWSYRVYQRQ